MSLEMVPVKVGGGSGASNEPWATSPEQGTQASTATLRAATTHQAPSQWLSQWRYFPTLYLPNAAMREGREGGKSRTTEQFAAWNTIHLKQQKNTCYSRNPICHLKVHDSLTTADQHWLDFNLALITFSHIKKSTDLILNHQNKLESGQVSTLFACTGKVQEEISIIIGIIKLFQFEQLVVNAMLRWLHHLLK